jgi:hypothetical protein
MSTNVIKQTMLRRQKSPAIRSAGPWRTARQESAMFPAMPLVEEMSGMNDVISTTQYEHGSSDPKNRNQ